MVALVFALALQHDLSLSFGPETADKALAHLAIATGEKLVCSPELKREVVMMRVKNTSWQDLKARLARLCWAEWRKRGDEWVFERPKSYAEKIERDVRAQQAKEIAAQIRQKLNAVKPWSPATLNAMLIHISSLAEKSYTAGRAGDSRPINDLAASGIETPVGRAAVRLLGSIRAEDLVALQPNQMAVYANAPTAMERPLPSDAGAIFQDFLREQAEFARAVQERKDLFAPVEYLDPRFYVTPDAIPTRFVMTVRRYSWWDIEVTLTAVDKDGWIVARGGNVSLNITLGAQEPLKRVPATPIEFSQRAREFEAIYLVNSGRFGEPLPDRRETAATTQRWIPTLAKADEIEPMSFIIGEGLEQASSAMNLDVVADLPDLLLAWMPRTDGRKTTVASFLSVLTAVVPGISAHVQDGCLEVMPLDPGETSFSRIDRVALGELVRDVDARKRAMVDDLARYAAKVPGPLLFNSIDEAYAEIHRSGSFSTGATGLANSYYATVLRFWGSLSEAQHEILRHGGSVSVQNLSPAARHWLEVYVFDVPRVLATNFVTPFSLSKTSTAPRNVKDSPYEGLPNGIPSDTIIRGSNVESVVVKERIKGEDEELDSTPEGIGAWLGSDGLPLSGPDCPLLTVSYARANLVKLTFDFGGGYSAWTQFGDDPTKWSDQMPLDKLPEDIRSQIETRYASALDAKKKADAKAKTRTIPPSE